MTGVLRVKWRKRCVDGKAGNDILYGTDGKDVFLLVNPTVSLMCVDTSN
jgi:hypothetical protein